MSNSNWQSAMSNWQSDGQSDGEVDDGETAMGNNSPVDLEFLLATGNRELATSYG
jgi:hypothetical protein